MTNIFYVYEHWRTDRDECFYVGKGKNFRALSIADRSKNHKELMIKILESGFAIEVKIVASGLFEDAALLLEQERIKFWENCGIKLVNGVGSSGYSHTEETKIKISQSQKKRHQVS